MCASNGSYHENRNHKANLDCAYKLLVMHMCSLIRICQLSPLLKVLDWRSLCALTYSACVIIS